MTDHFTTVTEIEGQPISNEQMNRMCHRYHWAARFAKDKDVIEVACGAGQGLGLLNQTAASVLAGDVSPEVLAAAEKTYGSTIDLKVFPAEAIPLPDTSIDVVLLFEAIYYVSDPATFFSEAKRVLRPGGKLLIVTANRDLYDFTPSPFSSRYLGVRDLAAELGQAGFSTDFYGYIDVNKAPIRQRLLRPLKSAASKFGLVPKTMYGKKLLKKLFFGKMTIMPANLADVPFRYSVPAKLDGSQPNKTYKVIYCCADLG